MFRTSPVHHQEGFVEAVFVDWYVVIRVLLDTSSRYEVLGTSNESGPHKNSNFYSFTFIELRSQHLGIQGVHVHVIRA